MNLNGTIIRPAINKENVIFASIEDEQNSAIQIVLFKKYRPKQIAEEIINAELGDNVTIIGKLETNPMNNEAQVIVDKFINHSKVQYLPCPTEF